MTLRELIEALNKAPPEAMDQEVEMFFQKEGDDEFYKQRHGGIDIVEAIRRKDTDNSLRPWSVWLVNLWHREPEICPNDKRRKRLSELPGWVKDKLERTKQ